MIRKGGPKDYKVVDALWREAGLFPPTENPKAYLKDDDNHIFLVYEQDGKVVAAAVGLRFGPLANVASIAVHPNYQRRGIGTKLLNELCKQLQQKGAKIAILSLNTLSDKKQLDKFYKKNGFKGIRGVYLKRLTKNKWTKIYLI